MKVWHKGTTLCAKLYHLVGKQIGFNAGYTITFYPLHVVKSLEQVKKTLTRSLAEVSYIHSGDNNLLCTSQCCFSCLTQEQINTTIP